MNESFTTPGIKHEDIEFIEIRGQKVPLKLYLMNLNRKQRRQFEAERRKKNSHIKITRADTVLPEQNTPVEETLSEQVPEQINTAG